MQGLEFSEVYCSTIVFIMYPVECKTLIVVKPVQHPKLQATIIHTR